MQSVQTPRSTETLLSGFRNENELHDLLNLVGAARPQSPFVVTDLELAQEPVPDSAPKSRNDIFTAYLKFEADLGALCAAQGSMQKLLFGEGWSTIVDSPSTMGIYRVAEVAISNLVRLAQSHFAPPGIPLEINQYNVLEAVGMDRWREEYDRRNRRSDETVLPPVDLDKIWDHLEATYGGQAGIEISHRQNAQTIISQLSLKDDTELKRTASSVSINKRMYSTKKDYGANCGRYEPHHSHRENLVKLFKALGSVFEWAGMDQLSIELAPVRHEICNYDFTYKPRERATFTGLEVVFFKEQFEFKFSHAAAEKLMLYLGTYGQQ